jgi:hypothetical protein
MAEPSADGSPAIKPGTARVHQAAERLIIEHLSGLLGTRLEPKQLALPGGSKINVDGVSVDETVLVEAFAHQGSLKGGQKQKIAVDAFKLVTLAAGREPKPRLILALADDAAKAGVGGWLAEALESWNVEVVVAPLDATVKQGIATAQKDLYTGLYPPPAGGSSEPTGEL